MCHLLHSGVFVATTRVPMRILFVLCHYGLFFTNKPAFITHKEFVVADEFGKFISPSDYGERLTVDVRGCPD